MRSIKLILFFCITFSSNTLFSQNLAVIDINSIIDNNIEYIKITKEIEDSQKKYLENFNIEEEKLIKKLKDIEDSKLILNENEINIKVNNYNQELTRFSNLVEEFNFHYQKEIIKIRESILREIIVLLEKYAIKNNIDMVFDSTSYLIATNSINITNDIEIKLKEINFKLEYKDFENN